jgi:hypothetical protein
MRSHVRRIVASGLIVLMTVLGGAIAGCAHIVLTAAATGGNGSDDFAFIEGSAISCASARNCLAVGTSTGGAPTADAWNGKTWRPVAVPLPAGTSGGLTGVSCKAGSCLAIGNFSSNAGGWGAGFAVSWNGSTLTTIPAPPAPAGHEPFGLGDVSCVSAKDCITLVADMVSGSAVIDTWNGSRWRAQTAPDPAGVAIGLGTVSCVSATFCVFGGLGLSDSADKKPGLALWNGKALRPMKVPAPAATDVPTDYDPPVIYDVSCVSETSCAAVGSYLTDPSATTGFGFTEVLSGETWKETTISWPQGTSLSQLFGVSCTSATSCLAVGTAGSAGGGLSAAVVSYNGTTWTRPADLPGPGNGNSDYFGGVSCPTARHCVAAGQAGQAPFANANTILGSWNGSAWKLAAGL